MSIQPWQYLYLSLGSNHKMNEILITIKIESIQHNIPELIPPYYFEIMETLA